MKIRTTVEAAAEIGVRPQMLQRLCWDGSLEKPQRIGRNFAWSDSDVSRAKRYIEKHNDKHAD